MPTSLKPCNSRREVSCDSRARARTSLFPRIRLFLFLFSVPLVPVFFSPARKERGIYVICRARLYEKVILRHETRDLPGGSFVVVTRWRDKSVGFFLRTARGNVYTRGLYNAVTLASCARFEYGTRETRKREKYQPALESMTYQKIPSRTLRRNTPD